MKPYAKQLVIVAACVTLIAGLLLLPMACGPNKFVGKWVAVDDKTSVIKIEKDGHAYRVVTEDGISHTATGNGDGLRFVEITGGLQMPADITLNKETGRLTITYMGPVSIEYRKQK